MNRRELRTHIFKILFEVEFREPDEMTELTELYISSLSEVSFDDSAYISQKCSNIFDKLSVIDQDINDVAVGWKTSRMNKVDLAILRLAVFEIYFDEEVPDKVAVNEAVELSKEYSTPESAAFVNGILASIVRKTANGN